MKILLVDDEQAMVMALKDNLECEGYDVDTAYGGQKALDLLKTGSYDLIILDVMMPDIDGFDVLEKMHESSDYTPVIFLTARSVDEDKIHGLGLGADDYVTKPFNLLELMARVNAVLRRTSGSSDLKSIKMGAATVDFAAQVVNTPDETIPLGRYEIALLRLMASQPGKVFSRDELLNSIWGIEANPTNRTIDNYMLKMRKKIEPDPQKPRYLVSAYASGYKLILD